MKNTINMIKLLFCFQSVSMIDCRSIKITRLCAGLSCFGAEAKLLVGDRDQSKAIWVTYLPVYAKGYRPISKF